MFRHIALQMIANTVAVVATASVLPREIDFHGNYATVIVFALVLGLLNASITPLLQLITVPLSCLTFGLSRFAVNVLIFLAAAWLFGGGLLTVTLLGGVAGSLVAAVAAGALTLLLGRR